MATITMIKQDASIDVRIGTKYISELQQLLSTLVEERSLEELQQYRALLDQPEPEFPETWMRQLFLMSLLVHSIEKAAAEQGQTYEKELPDEPILQDS